MWGNVIESSSMVEIIMEKSDDSLVMKITMPKKAFSVPSGLFGKKHFE
jgi:hypothetical protein